jgi:hypothetical protein
MNYTYEILHDTNPESPREWDNFGRMICFHKRYNLGDKNGMKSSDFEGWEDLKSYLVKNENAKVILPLYLYDHSGITISTAPFGCNFDSGQIGFIYCTEEDMSDNGMAGKVDEERAEVLLKGEVETYDSYLRGEVYGFEVYSNETCSLGHSHKELLDSCFGYYSEDEAEQEALSFVNHYKQKDLEKV